MMNKAREGLCHQLEPFKKEPQGVTRRVSAARQSLIRRRLLQPKGSVMHERGGRQETKKRGQQVMPMHYRPWTCHRNGEVELLDSWFVAAHSWEFLVIHRR
ncbi:Sugar transporter STL1 [Fusarium oxysporum f. sp. albedinis]|nr:Sugar transporter STL1 [Fusarium oxysporum f. sp. albedinis]